MAKEYIDLEVAIRTVTKLEKEKFGYNFTAPQIKSALASIKSADVVPVVRCEHCQSYEYGYCNLLKNPMDPQDFCSYGRRCNNGKE